MKAALKLNLADVDRAIREMVAREHPEIELEGYIVMSWNLPLLQVSGDTMVHPTRHHIRREHAELPGTT